MPIGKKRSDKRLYFLLILPSVTILILTIGYPLINGIILGFHYYRLTDPTRGMVFNGLQNFRMLLFENRIFWITLYRTFLYCLGSTGVSFLFGFLIALLLYGPIRNRSLFRSLFLLPWVIPSTVVALLWLWIFNPQYGILNFLLKDLGLIRQFQSWLVNPSLALPSVILATSWKYFPFFMLMLLAGLETIPMELFEASTIDGATFFQRLRYIILPSLKEIIIIVTILEIIWEFQNFTIIWILTKGGPVYQTTTMGIQIYRTAFRNYDMGMGAAMGSLSLVAMLIFSLSYIKTLKFGEGD